VAAPAGRPRITGGVARGRVLPTPIPSSARPTSSRVREALFDLVGHDLSGQRVLDAFGGSGLLGLEAWSRGAEVVLVERDAAALRSIRANVASLGATIDVVGADVLRWAATAPPFDGVLVDPPYAMDPSPILAALGPLAKAWLVLEGSRQGSSPACPPGLVMDRERWYGDTVLRVFVSEGR